jgi:hypothetical protein
VIWFAVVLLLAAIVSGATASVVGFDIGSLLTPLLADRSGAARAARLVSRLRQMDLGL